MSTDMSFLLKLRQITNEVLSTEESYVRSLMLIRDMYLRPLQSQCPRLSQNQSGNIPDKTDPDENGNTVRIPAEKPAVIRALFSNSMDLLEHHEQLLTEMKERAATQWTDETAYCRVADLFCRSADWFSLYTVYCQQYMASADLVAKRCKHSSIFANWLDFLKNDVRSRGLDLPSLLIMPVQRLPRYLLFLKDLEQRTPAHYEAELNELRHAWKLTSEAADTCNEGVRIAEEMQKLLRLQRKFKGGKTPLLAEPGRRFVRKGTLSKVTRHMIRECRFLLFSDILVYAYGIGDALHYKGTIQLGTSWIQDIPESSSSKHRFQLVTKEKTYTLLTKSLEKKHLWVNAINQQIEALVSQQPELIYERRSAVDRKSSGGFFSKRKASAASADAMPVLPPLVLEDDARMDDYSSLGSQQSSGTETQFESSALLSPSRVLSASDIAPIDDGVIDLSFSLMTTSPEPSGERRTMTELDAEEEHEDDDAEPEAQEQSCRTAGSPLLVLDRRASAGTSTSEHTASVDPSQSDEQLLTVADLTGQQQLAEEASSDSSPLLMERRPSALRTSEATTRSQSAQAAQSRVSSVPLSVPVIAAPAPSERTTLLGGSRHSGAHSSSSGAAEAHNSGCACACLIQ